MGPPVAGPTAGAMARAEDHSLPQNMHAHLCSYTYATPSQGLHTVPPKARLLRLLPASSARLSPASSQPWHMQLSTHSGPSVHLHTDS